MMIVDNNNVDNNYIESYDQNSHTETALQLASSKGKLVRAELNLKLIFVSVSSLPSNAPDSTTVSCDTSSTLMEVKEMLPNVWARKVPEVELVALWSVLKEPTSRNWLNLHQEKYFGYLEAFLNPGLL